MLPVVLFPRQREFIAWLHERFTTKTSAPVEKSRDSGATWMSAAFAVWVWLFHPGSTVGFGSRKEILVDRAGDLQSIFEKIRSHRPQPAALPQAARVQGAYALELYAAPQPCRTIQRSSARPATTLAEAGAARCSSSMRRPTSSAPHSSRLR